MTQDAIENQTPTEASPSSNGLVMLPEHPCWTGDDYNHDWEFQDDSFDHEFGTEQIHYYLCNDCGATRELEAEDYDPFLELDLEFRH